MTTFWLIFTSYEQKWLVSTKQMFNIAVFYIYKREDLFFQRERENLGKEPDLKTHLLQVKGSRFKRTHRVALTRKKTTTFASSPDTKHISKSYRKNLSKSHTQDNDTSSPLKYTTHVLLYIYRNVRFICSKYYHAWVYMKRITLGAEYSLFKFSCKCRNTVF